MSLRVAAAQAESVSGDVEANVATAVSLVAAAAEQGARVVVLPELFLTGYHPAGWSDATCLTTDDARLAPLEQILLGPSTVADGRSNLIGALRRSMATTGYTELKEFQRVEVVVQ